MRNVRSWPAWRMTMPPRDSLCHRNSWQLPKTKTDVKGTRVTVWQLPKTKTDVMDEGADYLLAVTRDEDPGNGLVAAPPIGQKRRRRPGKELM